MASGNSVLLPRACRRDRNKSLLHLLSNGRLVITGKLTEQVTNLQTGESQSFKASGPLRIIPHDDGSATVMTHGRLF